MMTLFEKKSPYSMRKIKLAMKHVQIQVQVVCNECMKHVFLSLHKHNKIIYCVVHIPLMEGLTCLLSFCAGERISSG